MGGNRRPAAGFSAQVAQVAQLPRSMKALTWQVLWTRPRPDPLELCTAVCPSILLDLSQQDWNSMDI